MTDVPWQGDACSLVDAFRSGERHPVEELEATLRAIDSTRTRSFSFVDPERALEAARIADTSKPFGGVPFGIKELSQVQGWPDTQACLVFADRVASYTSTANQRAIDRGGAVPVGLTTASEFGGLNVSVTKLNGITHNPWDLDRTAGGSSGGSAAAVAAGLVTMATGGDGGGSIRIPAAFQGQPGMKGTYGRIPRGPHMELNPMTVVVGLMCRSIRDIARYYDVASGYDSRDPSSLPRVDGWEAALGSHRDELRGKRVAIVPDLGVAVVRPELVEMVHDAGRELADAAGLVVVEADISFPGLGFEWAIGNLSNLLADLDGFWPECRDELTREMAFGLDMAVEHMSLETAARAETARTAAAEAMADAFDQVDFVISATNPDVAFPAHLGVNTRVGEQRVGLENNGALTIPYNIVGNPSLSLPIGQIDGLPVGMQVATRHHHDALLLDLGEVFRSVRPWPLVAPTAPC